MILYPLNACGSHDEKNKDFYSKVNSRVTTIYQSRLAQSHHDENQEPRKKKEESPCPSLFIKDKFFSKFSHTISKQYNWFSTL